LVGRHVAHDAQVRTRDNPCRRAVARCVHRNASPCPPRHWAHSMREMPVRVRIKPCGPVRSRPRGYCGPCVEQPPAPKNIASGPSGIWRAHRSAPRPDRRRARPRRIFRARKLYPFVRPTLVALPQLAACLGGTSAGASEHRTEMRGNFLSLGKAAVAGCHQIGNPQKYSAARIFTSVVSPKLTTHSRQWILAEARARVLPHGHQSISQSGSVRSEQQRLRPKDRPPFGCVKLAWSFVAQSVEYHCGYTPPSRLAPGQFGRNECIAISETPH